MKFIALTSHSVTLLRPDTPTKEAVIRGRSSLVFDGEDSTPYISEVIPASGLPVPSVVNEGGEPATFTLETENGTEVTVIREGTGKEVIKDLPEPQDGVVYIASSFTSAAAVRQGRQDVFAPRTLVLSLSKDGSTTILGTIELK